MDMYGFTATDIKIVSIKFFFFQWNFTEICSQGSTYSNTGSDNALVPTKRTNDGRSWWGIYASLGLNELKI